MDVVPCPYCSVEKTYLLDYAVDSTGRRQVIHYSQDKLTDWQAIPAMSARPSIFRLRPWRMLVQLTIVVTIMVASFVIAHFTLCGGQSSLQIWEGEGGWIRRLGEPGGQVNRRPTTPLPDV